MVVPEYSVEEKNKAFQWAQKNKAIHSKKVGTTHTKYYIATASNNDTNKDIVENSRQENCRSLEDFRVLL